MDTVSERPSDFALASAKIYAFPGAEFSGMGFTRHRAFPRIHAGRTVCVFLCLFFPLLAEKPPECTVRTRHEHTRSPRHEIRSHYFLLETLIREGKNDEVIAYIHQTIEPTLSQEDKVSTGNSFVDMLLPGKTAEARKLGIPVTLNVLLPANPDINQEMLCSLLFNLWDNAIEASAKVSSPDIRFSMHMHKSYLNVVISNCIDGSVLETNPKLTTSKADPLRHGMGIRLIRKAVESHRGDMRIYEEDGYFMINIYLEVGSET